MAQLYGSDKLRPPVAMCEPGPFLRKFREKFRKPIQELCGDNGEALVMLCQVICLRQLLPRWLGGVVVRMSDL